MQVKKKEAESIFNKLKIEMKSIKHHISGWFTYEGRKILPVYFSHGMGDMPGKVGDKFRQSFKVDEEQFKGLRDCPIDRDAYIKILKEKRIISN